MRFPRHVERVLAAVAERTGVSVEDVQSASRVSSVARARRLAAYSLRKSLGSRGLSMSEIGVALGGKDHTSVLKQVRAVDEALAAGDTDVAADVAAVAAAAARDPSTVADDVQSSWEGRRRLPDTRDSVTVRFTLADRDDAGKKVKDVDFYFTVGFYPDGRPGEMFVRASKQGEFMSGVLDYLGACFSLALQHGCPFEKLIEKARRTNFLPCGATGDPEFPRASSFIDAFAQWAEARVLPPPDPPPDDSSGPQSVDPK